MNESISLLLLILNTSVTYAIIGYMYTSVIKNISINLHIIQTKDNNYTKTIHSQPILLNKNCKWTRGEFFRQEVD